jgi:hypothetical protein
MLKYQVLSPIKTADGIVTEGYVEVIDSEVEELTRIGAIGEIEPIDVNTEPVPVAASKSKKAA